MVTNRIKQILKHKTKVGLIGVVGFMSLILAGCSKPVSEGPQFIPSVQNTQTAWHTHQSILKNLTSWEASGVIGIRVNNKGESANVFWKVKSKNDYVIQIYGTAGLGAISITGRPDGSVIFKDSNGKETYAKNVEDLMQKRLGWSLPVQGLYYWGRGLPAPIASKELSLNRYGLMSSIAQSGWEIEYYDYKMYNNTYPLPSRITLHQGNLNIKLVIKSWSVD